jgi:hypothetical protein
MHRPCRARRREITARHFALSRRNARGSALERSAGRARCGIVCGLEWWPRAHEEQEHDAKDDGGNAGENSARGAA